MNKNKKGLSPVIATVLLIALALILASLIFIWASSFLKEKNQKFGSPVEDACKDILFDAELYGGNLHVVNRGTVPMQSFEIKSKKSGSVESLGTFGGTKTLAEGESEIFDLTGVSVNTGDDIIVTPIIYGMQGGQRTPYTCDSSELNIKAG